MALLQDDKNKLETEQLEFWCGHFGDDYMKRNLASLSSLRNRIDLWSQILKTLKTLPIDSILEVGSNIGLNLRALQLLTASKLYAIEPNQKALDILVQDKVVEEANAYCTNAFDQGVFQDGQMDLVFTSGVLIHIHPDDLERATANIVRMSKRFVVCVEYFSPNAETIDYRNNKNVLFKRDFGAFYLDQFSNLELRDYGFAWSRATGLDNLTWWLFEKTTL
jgi:spore coat polysaccharide biosynthesis protein SpsF